MKKIVAGKKMVAGMLSATMLASGTLVVKDSSAMNITNQNTTSNFTTNYTDIKPWQCPSLANATTNYTTNYTSVKPLQCLKLGNKTTNYTKNYTEVKPGKWINKANKATSSIKQPNKTIHFADNSTVQPNKTANSTTGKTNESNSVKSNTTTNSTTNESWKCTKLLNVNKGSTDNSTNSLLLQCDKISNAKSNNSKSSTYGGFWKRIKQTNKTTNSTAGSNVDEANEEKSKSINSTTNKTINEKSNSTTNSTENGVLKCTKIWDVLKDSDKNSSSSVVVQCEGKANKASDEKSNTKKDSTKENTKGDPYCPTDSATASLENYDGCIPASDDKTNEEKSNTTQNSDDNGSWTCINNGESLECTKDKATMLEGIWKATRFVGRGLNKTKNFVSLLSSLCNDVFNIGKMAFVSYMGAGVGRNMIKHTVCCKMSFNTDKVMKNLDKELQVIKGQENAKKSIRAAVAGVIDKRCQAKKLKQPYKHGDVIYMIGPSGVGKTYSAECMAKAIMGKKVKIYSIGPADLDATSYNGSSSPARDQILNVRESGSAAPSMLGNDGGNYNWQDSLHSRIKANPKFVLILNEYDKMCDKSTDEMLRSVVDNGTLSVSGEKIDCSNILIIITSNEDARSIEGANTNKVAEDDGTGSRTAVKHDKSFLNRLHPIKFDNLYEKDYSEVTKQLFKSVLEFYEKEYGIKVVLSEEAIKEIAKKAVAENIGARSIEKEVINKFRNAFIEKRLSAPEGTTYKGKTFIANYSASSGEFTFEVK